MPRSLLFKMLGAFGLVILAGALIVAVLVNRATSGQFRLYADRNGQLWATQLAPQLEAYYAQQGSWQGVESALQGSNSMMGSARGMMGGMMPERAQATGTNMWAMMGLRVVFADTRGQVVSDSADLLTGQTLPAAQLAAGTPIQVNGQTVGTVSDAGRRVPQGSQPLDSAGGPGSGSNRSGARRAPVRPAHCADSPADCGGPRDRGR
jgi:hypothetical protein